MVRRPPNLVVALAAPKSEWTWNSHSSDGRNQLLENASQFIRQARLGEDGGTTGAGRCNLNGRINTSSKDDHRDVASRGTSLHLVDEVPAASATDKLYVGHNGVRTLTVELNECTGSVGRREYAVASVLETQRVHLERIGAVIDE
jgi:hypothetical protein